MHIGLMALPLFVLGRSPGGAAPHTDRQALRQAGAARVAGAGPCAPSFRELGPLLLRQRSPGPEPLRREPAIFSLLDRCAAGASAAVEAHRADAPRRLLEVGRLFVALEASYLEGVCGGLEAYARSHSSDFYVHTGHEGLAVCEYSGSHLETLVRLFPNAPQVAEARCLLSGRGFQDRALFGEACVAFRAGLRRGPCDRPPPPGCEARLNAAERCEAAAFAAPIAEQWALFIGASRLFRSAGRACRATNAEFASAQARRPELFDWGTRSYIERHLGYLEEHGPDERARDEAAWALVLAYDECAPIPTGPDTLRCETHAVTHFLSERPSSPHAEEATRRLITSVRRHVRVLRQGRRGDAQWNAWMTGTVEGGAVMQLGHMIEKLPPRLAEQAAEAAAPFMDLLGEHDVARGFRLAAARRLGRPSQP